MRTTLLATAFIALSTTAFADTPLVGVDWLEGRLTDDGIAVLDIRNRIDGGSAETFAAGHIPGAVYSNYAEAGWRAESEGVIGMLPDVPHLEDLIGGLGIGNDDHVVIVHGGNGSGTDFGSAARIYWTFKVLGHDAVSILDGGYAAWDADETAPIATGAVTPIAATFTADLQPQYLATTEDVRAALDSEVLLVDARPPAQYLGEEKAGPVANPGTIPGAVNIPNADFVQATGLAQDSDTIAALLAAVGGDADTPQIAFCNTGHWASVAWFGLSEIAGIEDVRMYDGSMTAWAADESNPLVLGGGS